MKISTHAAEVLDAIDAEEERQKEALRMFCKREADDALLRRAWRWVKDRWLWVKWFSL